MNESGPTVLLTKFSEDNKEITFAWVSAFGTVIEKSAQTIKLNNIATLAESLVDNSLPKITPQSNGTNKAYILGYEGNTFKPNANMTRAEACTIFARLILGVQSIPNGYTTRFEDVKKSDWFYNAVAYLDETGFFFRNKNTTYAPNEPITRAEFVDLANAASALNKGNKLINFADVPTDHFYYDSIIAAAGAGLVNGYEDGTFRPDNTITRAEVVTVINRLLGLKATERTISLEHIENEFVDIKAHWARLNIIMASNSNVHTANYYKADLDGVTQKGSDIIFKNKHFSIALSKKNGKITSFTNLYTGDDIKSGTGSQFISLTNTSGANVLPSSLEIENNAIKISFKNYGAIYMLVDVTDNYMTFEIDSELPSGISKITFANISTTLTTANTDNDFMLNGIAMSYWTNPVNKGYSPTANSTIAHSYSQYDAGTTGAKMGVVFSKKADAIKYLQELTDAIDPAVGLTSKAGGAYALDWEGNFGDYAIILDLNPDLLDQNLKLARELDIDQIDIHQGSKTFRQGDFFFHNTESGTAAEYYEKTGKKIADAGIKTGLHTYAYYINYNASGILADPKWQSDLERLDDTYTLRKRLTKTAANIATVEDATKFDTTATFFYKNSRYILIDEEIIYVGQGTSSGFINVKRAQCGTNLEKHEEGTKIYHLSGYFNMFVPKLGSNLYFHIADLTAKVYNEGGFDMIYLDAIDGLSKHLPEGHETWYYFHEFVHRIVSQCERTPIIETSSSAPSEWNVRGRCGAWDTANRSIKKMIGEHLKANMSAMNSNQATTLGWFDFCPDSNPTAGMKNTMQKTIFHDDFDALGMGALLYNTSIVFNSSSFNAEAIMSSPFRYDNIKYYTETYSKLRKSQYFTKDTIEKVKAIGGEWKVIEKNKGEYAFLQMYYNASNLTYAPDYTINSVSCNNPFKTQTPFIRIESRYSTLFENEITLYDFKEMNASPVTKSISPVDMTVNMAMTLRVKGTGNDGDAILLSMVGGVTSGESGGRADYFIDLNFEGWRDVVLLDLDSAEYDTQKYVFSGIGTNGMQYATYRTIANYGAINTLYIRTTGKTADNALIGELKAYTQTEAPIKNPTITVGSSTVTFNCSMKGGEYLEYDPLTGKAILYHNASETKEEVTFTGKLSVPAGSFKAVYTAEAETNAPVRARVVLGFSGQEITN